MTVYSLGDVQLRGYLDRNLWKKKRGKWFLLGHKNRGQRGPIRE